MTRHIDTGIAGVSAVVRFLPGGYVILEIYGVASRDDVDAIAARHGYFVDVDLSDGSFQLGFE